MNVYVSSGETVETSFSYANWKNSFATICTPSDVCGAIKWSFSVVTAVERDPFNEILDDSVTPYHEVEIVDNDTLGAETVTLSMISEN